MEGVVGTVGSVSRPIAYLLEVAASHQLARNLGGRGTVAGEIGTFSPRDRNGFTCAVERIISTDQAVRRQIRDMLGVSLPTPLPATSPVFAVRPAPSRW
jgi:hypothetical protein